MKKTLQNLKKMDLPVMSEEQKRAFDIMIEEKTKNQMEEFKNTLEKLVTKLEPLGWTLPVEMGIYPINILGKTDKIQDISQFFIEYFSINDYRNFKQLIEGINKSTIEDRFKRAVNECVFAFDNKRYIITVNTLLSVIEGMLSLFHENKENTRMMHVCKEMVESICDDANSIIDKYIWKSYDNFITKLYSKKSFNDTEPVEINRHWLLHGRSEYNVSEIECIKLFNAVSTICCTINQHEKKEKVIESSV